MPVDEGMDESGEVVLEPVVVGRFARGSMGVTSVDDGDDDAGDDDDSIADGDGVAVAESGAGGAEVVGVVGIGLTESSGVSLAAAFAASVDDGDFVLSVVFHLLHILAHASRPLLRSTTPLLARGLSASRRLSPVGRWLAAVCKPLDAERHDSELCGATAAASGTRDRGLSDVTADALPSV